MKIWIQAIKSELNACSKIKRKKPTISFQLATNSIQTFKPKYVNTHVTKSLFNIDLVRRTSPRHLSHKLFFSISRRFSLYGEQLKRKHRRRRGTQPRCAVRRRGRFQVILINVTICNMSKNMFSLLKEIDTWNVIFNKSKTTLYIYNVNIYDTYKKCQKKLPS